MNYYYAPKITAKRIAAIFSEQIVVDGAGFEPPTFICMLRAFVSFRRVSWLR